MCKYVLNDNSKYDNNIYIRLYNPIFHWPVAREWLPQELGGKIPC